MTKVLTQMSSFFSAESEEPRKSEEKQKEGASSDDLYCSIDQLPQYGAILFPFHAHQIIVYISFHI